MKNLLSLLLLLPVYLFAQVDTTIVVPPSKDTTRIRVQVVTTFNQPAPTITSKRTFTITSSPGAVTPPPVDTTQTGTRKNIIFYSSFNGVSTTGKTIPAEIGGSWSNEQHLTTWGVVPAPVTRLGSGAIKFELRPGDPIVSGSYRSEIQGPGNGATNYEEWYSMSLYPINLNGGSLSVIQWHAEYNNAQGTPPLGLWVTGGKWCVVRTQSGYGSGNNYGFLGVPVLNKWTDFVFHVKFSPTSSGLIEVWQDGAKVYTYNGVTAYPSGGNYVKTGIYQWDGVKSTQIMYMDEFRIGNASATLNDMKP